MESKSRSALIGTYWIESRNHAEWLDRNVNEGNHRRKEVMAPSGKSECPMENYIIVPSYFLNLWNLPTGAFFIFFCMFLKEMPSHAQKNTRHKLSTSFYVIVLCICRWPLLHCNWSQARGHPERGKLKVRLKSIIWQWGIQYENVY